MNVCNSMRGRGSVRRGAAAEIAKRRRAVLAVAASLAGLGITHHLAAQTLFFDTNGTTAGIGGSGTWDASTTSDWSTTSAGNLATQKWTSGGVADFGGANGTVTVNGSVGITGITFDSSGTGGFTLGGSGSLSLTGNTTVNQSSSFGQTIGVNFAGTNNSSTVTFTGNGNGAVTLSGTMSGSNGGHPLSIDKEGSSTFVLANSVAYSNFSGVTVGGGTLQIGNGSTTGLLAFNITDNVNGTVAFKRSDTVTYANVISGSGALAQLGTGTLVLTSANPFTGLTTISGGTLQLGNGTSTGSVGGNILNNATLAFNASGNATYAGNISGTGALAQLGSSILVLTGTNSFSGTTTISAGTLQIGNGGATGSITGNIVDNAALTFNRTNTFTYAGNISGSGSLTQSGTGTTIFTGADSRTGTATISAGTLQIGNGGTSGSIASGSISDNGNLTFNRSDSLTYAGTLSGTGSLVQTGGGTLVLTSNNSLSGVTTIDPSSTLQLGNGSVGGLVAGDVTDNGSLFFNRSDNPTFAGAISGSGSLTQNGAGTLVLTGSSTFSGGTTINAGTLQVGAGGASGAITGPVVNNGLLAFNRSNNLTYLGAISGTGALTQMGAGTLSLSASNSYSGGTNLNAGTINFSSLNNLGAGGLTFRGGTLQWASGNSDDISSRTVTITGGGASFDVGSSNTVTIASAIGNGGTGSFNKLGSGTLILQGANTYTGPTIIGAGTLQLDGSLAASSAVTVSSAGTLTGTGSAAGSISIGGTVAPGSASSIGTLNLGDTTLAPGGVYVWKLADASASPGSGWDNINMGLLSVTASSATPFTIKITSLNTQNFDPTGQYTFNIGTYSGTNPSNDFAASKFTLDTSGFGPGLGAYRAFAIQTDGAGHVQLNYYAVPEPSSFLILAGIGAGGLLRRRRVRRVRRRLGNGTI